MSGESTSAGASFTKLRPFARPADLPARADDTRLGEVVGFEVGAISAGSPVIVGFPTDKGVRRNGGRVGAAEAPAEIRRWLYRMVAFDACRGHDLAALSVIDTGDIAVTGDLEADQVALGAALGDLLRLGAVPIGLAGRHETAFGVYLGHVLGGGKVGIINLDAHLDVRPTHDGKGHSGSPFRQAMEHAPAPLPGSGYVCVGAQPFSVSRQHLDVVRSRGGKVFWRDEVAGRLDDHLTTLIANLGREASVHLSIDADVVTAADVPGVSAPNPAGLAGDEVVRAAYLAGSHPLVS